MIITDEAIEDCLDLGLELEEFALGELVRNSARVTHGCGNRRYGSLIFNVDEGVLKRVFAKDGNLNLCIDCLGVGYTTMYDDFTNEVHTIKCASCNQLHQPEII